jgi:hypothetical protein
MPLNRSKPNHDSPHGSRSLSHGTGEEVWDKRRGLPPLIQARDGQLAAPVPQTNPARPSQEVDGPRREQHGHRRERSATRARRSSAGSSSGSAERRPWRKPSTRGLVSSPVEATRSSMPHRSPTPPPVVPEIIPFPRLACKLRQEIPAGSATKELELLLDVGTVLSAIARSSDGELPGEPRGNSARTEPCPPGIMQGRLAEAI